MKNTIIKLFIILKKEAIERSNEPDSEIPCSSTAGHGASDPAIESTVSSSSSCCRICQDNGETSGKLTDFIVVIF
jgi:hypothetical protein